MLSSSSSAFSIVTCPLKRGSGSVPDMFESSRSNEEDMIRKELWGDEGHGKVC